MKTQERTGRKTAAVGGVLACVLVLVLVSASKWTVPMSDGTEATGAGPGASTAARTASAPASADAKAPRAMAQAASSGASAAASAPDTLSPRARRMRDDWCGFGMAEGLREAQAREARNEAARKAGTPEEDTEDDDASQVVAQAREARHLAWIRTLRSRGDPRSQAIADLLSRDPSGGPHLQDLARRSTDPMVTALALMQPCPAPGCQTIDAAQWSRLEPDNLMAWVAQIEVGRLRPDQLMYLIERMGRDARRAETYLDTLGQVIASLSGDAAPGLQQIADIELMTRPQGSYPLAGLMQVLQACKSHDLPLPMRASCERIADLLWDMPDQLSRSVALSLVSDLVPSGHPRRSEWEQRALHFDAAVEALMADNRSSMAHWADKLPERGCQAVAEVHARLRHTLQIPQWELAEQALAASPDGREALVERARAKRGGRSPLDPAPTRAAPAAPASASGG